MRRKDTLSPQNVASMTCTAKRPHAYVLRYGRFAVLQGSIEHHLNQQLYIIWSQRNKRK
jgi:hypothetical protein